MATPLPADRLLAALRAEGVTVVEHPGWRSHNRNHTGAWGPVTGVMIHHTVSSGTRSTVEMCFNGYEGLPGPLCHGVIAKDGTVHLVANGRANHAGGWPKLGFVDGGLGLTRVTHLVRRRASMCRSR